MKTIRNRIIILVIVCSTVFSCSKDDKFSELPKEETTKETTTTENPVLSETTISGAVVLPAGSTVDVNTLTITSPTHVVSVSEGSYEMKTLDDKFLTQMVTDAKGEVLLMGFNYPGQTDFEINAKSTALALLMNLPSSLLLAPTAKQELIALLLNDPNLDEVVSAVETQFLNGTNPLDVSQIYLVEYVALYYRQLLYPEANKTGKSDYSYDPVDIRVTNNKITFVNLGKTYETVVGIYKDDVKIENINVERVTFLPTTIGDAMGAFASAYGGTELPGNLQPIEYAYTFESDGQYTVKIRTSKLADDAIENDIALLNNIINWGTDLIVEILPLGDCIQPVIADFKQHAQTFGSFSDATTEQQKMGLLYDVLYTFFNQSKTLITCFGSGEDLKEYLKKFANVFKFLDLVGKIGNGGNIMLGIAQLVADEGKMDLCYNVNSDVASECAGNDVYAASVENGVATVWKNGIATSLAEGGNGAFSLYVSGSDVYVAGSVVDQTNTVGVATVWKNGVATLLTDGSNSASATSVYVSGNDVYVVGYQINDNNNHKYVATLWKNGFTTLLTNNGHNAYATSVHVSGNDVYVVGSESNANNIDIAKVWKNGVATSLTDGTKNASAESVYVSNGDIYVAGYEYLNENTLAVAKIWKNGVATSLTDGSNQAFAHSVFIEGDDVYVAGLEYNGTVSVAKLWRNGIATSLTYGDNFAVAVFVKGNDVYVAGHEDNGNNQLVAKVWKNGEATILSDGSGNHTKAYSVFVK